MATILLCTMLLTSADRGDYVKYIDKYYQIAVREMYRSGVPASITLAQGLLESGAGKSRLASQGNNHFGIKCHNWKGKSMKVDDDAPKECFRVYDSAEESFRDHSDFLRYWDRYKFLFEYDRTDYKAWAYGLKKAGYATDPAYPAKLIKLIEDYGLQKYDTMPLDGKPQAEVPKSPLQIEQEIVVNKRNGVNEEYEISLSRKEYSKNGVLCVHAIGGETYESIAKANHLFLAEILRYNDLKQAQDLKPGDIVYLAAKRSKTAKGLDKYIVEQDGEDIWAISQRFGVKLKSLLKKNGYKSVEGIALREGDELRLR